MSEEKESVKIEGDNDRLDSIKVGVTSKGLHSFEVKRFYDFRFDDPALVIKSIKKMYATLKEEFPNKE